MIVKEKAPALCIMPVGGPGHKPGVARRGKFLAGRGRRCGGDTEALRFANGSLPTVVAITVHTDIPDGARVAGEKVPRGLSNPADDTLSPADRVAGCLVLQYGQSCWRLVNLTADDVHAHPGEPGILGLQLGRDSLWLRPRLVTNRRPLAGALRDHATPYLSYVAGRLRQGQRMADPE